MGRLKAATAPAPSAKAPAAEPVPASSAVAQLPNKGAAGAAGDAYSEGVGEGVLAPLGVPLPLGAHAVAPCGAPAHAKQLASEVRAVSELYFPAGQG